MKKFLAYFVIILFAGVLSLSLIAFTNNPIKQNKAEAAVVTDTIKANCAHHQAIAGSDCKHAKAVADTCREHKAKTSETAATETKACCKEAGKTESGECAHAAACKHHKETTAEAK